MRLASKGGIGRWEREAFRWFRLRKRIHQYLKYRPGQPKTVVFITGCQRSGTSMLSHLFRLDWNVVTYDEMSPLSSADPEGFRWNPLPEVQARINADRAPLVVCKPLVESQRLPELLDAFPGSKAIWMFRDYRDVAQSNLKFFGGDNGHRDLAPILAAEEGNWRGEGLGEADRELVRELYAAHATDADAAALFWYCRNRVLYNRALEAEDRVRFCDYNRLVSDPAAILAGAYGFIGAEFPGQRVVDDVRQGSVGKGRDCVVAEPVAAHCDALLADLRALPTF